MKHITRKDLPLCMDGELYMYLSHPSPARCKIVSGKVNMICSKCTSSITNNWCKCSLSKKLLHEDRVLMRNAIKSHKPTNETRKKFVETKGCSIDHFKSIFKEDIGTQHGNGNGTWSFDHIISPATHFDLNKQNHREFIFHYKNIQKLIYPSNQKKGCKVIQAEIDYVLSVIDSMEIDKIHDQLKIMRTEHYNKISNKDLSNKELVNKNIEPKIEATKNSNVLLMENQVIHDNRQENTLPSKKAALSSSFWKLNSVINKLIIEREKEENNLNMIRKRISSINDLIKLEIEKSTNEIKKENNEIDKRIYRLQDKKMKNEESLSLLNSYLCKSY